MAFPMGKGRNEQGTFHKHIYYKHTYTVMQSCNIQARSKSNTTEYDYNVQSLNRCYLAGHGATNIHSKARNGHPQRRGWQTGSADLYGTGPGGPNGSRETVAGYLPPSVVGESRRPVSTAASVAALPGLSRGRRALSGAPHTDAQARATQPAELRLQSASPVRRSDSPPTHASNERVAPRTASLQTPTKTGPATRQDRTNSNSNTNTTRPRQEHEPQDPGKKQQAPKLACHPPFISWGSAHRPSPFLAPPSFQKLLEKGRALSPPPRAQCGGRGKSVLAQVQGIIPPPPLRGLHNSHPPPSAQSYRHVVPPLCTPLSAFSDGFRRVVVCCNGGRDMSVQNNDSNRKTLSQRVTAR